MTVNDVILGDVLMLFNADGESIGGATNHTLTVSPEYNDISCKDAGIWGWKKLKKVGWEIQSENLYIEAEYLTYLNNTINDTEFTVIFGSSDWDKDGLSSAKTNYAPTTTASTSESALVSKEMLYTGKVKISSLTLNAQSGENATYSVTFTGCGPLSKYTAG